MKEIPLTQGRVALVDDDFEYLNQWKWYAKKHEKTYYAQRIKNGKCIKMHRVIMETTEGIEVDHRDHNGLNNQKCNLRNCTRAQNSANRRPCGKIKYLGVSHFKRTAKNGELFIGIRAMIQKDSKNIYLGTFKTDMLAAIAYDEAAKKYHGEFANLNFKLNEKGVRVFHSLV